MRVSGVNPGLIDVQNVLSERREDGRVKDPPGPWLVCPLLSRALLRRWTLKLSPALRGAVSTAHLEIGCVKAIAVR